jgi:quinol monooxygenase YgiN
MIPAARKELQVTPDEFCALTHIDILLRVNPTAVEDCEDQLRELTAQASGETGVVSFVALKQTRRANHFEIIVRYSSERSYFDHLGSPANIKFRRSISPVIGSPYEDRLHRGRGYQEWPRGGPGDFVVVTQLDVSPDRMAELDSPLQRFIASRQQANGIVGQLCLQRPALSNRLELLSVWESPDAFSAYADSAEADISRTELEKLLIAPVEDRSHTVLCGCWY